MQIVENWSDVDGVIKELSASPSDPLHRLATIVIQSVQPVASFPNLMATHTGKEVTIRIPEEAVRRSGVAQGKRVRLRVRQAGPDKYFSHPDHVEQLA
jgi:hypothetical protein